jgi:ABC-type nitrate/sulfonate/bicarbonate transport system substrate-binding protein
LVLRKLMTSHVRIFQIIFALLLPLWVLPQLVFDGGAADPVAKITINVFPGGFNWPLFVGSEKGFFAENGVEVVLQPTPGSIAQMIGLARGEFDVAMTAIDNVVAYVEGQGEAPIGPQPEFFAFMASDSGFLSVLTRSEINSYADLRNKTLSVDAKTTGYAFVLFEMLRRNGVLEGDYNVVKAGGMLQRWEALRDGQQDGTLLATPFDIVAKSRGFNQLGKAIDVLGPYQGTVAATRRSWATQHERELVAFIRGYTASVAWLYNTANKDEAVRILTARLPNITPAVGRQTYDQLLDPVTGFFRDGMINVEGLRTVLALRSRYGEPKKELTGPTKYYDMRLVMSARN